MLDQCGVKEIQKKFLASSKKYVPGAKEKGSTGNAEQRITNIKEMGKALEQTNGLLSAQEKRPVNLEKTLNKYGKGGSSKPEAYQSYQEGVA